MKRTSSTINDSLGPTSEPATLTLTADPALSVATSATAASAQDTPATSTLTADPALSVSTSATAASAQVTQVAGVTVSIQLRPSHP
jgi:hypothetical protein